MQALEKLIANYGDASNTAWLDDRYKVWRHPDTGAAVGYSAFKGYAMIIGDPLCDKAQYTQVVSAFLHYIKKEAKLKPIWMMVCEEVEEILGGRLNWCSLSCAAEERVEDPAKNPARNDPDVQKKVRHARKEGVRSRTTLSTRTFLKMWSRRPTSASRTGARTARANRFT